MSERRTAADPLREALERIAKRHEESQGPWPPDGHVCIECWQRWPCDATQLAATFRIIPRLATPPLDSEGVTIDPERLARALERVPQWRRETDRYGGGTSRKLSLVEVAAAILAELEKVRP